LRVYILIFFRNAIFAVILNCLLIFPCSSNANTIDNIDDLVMLKDVVMCKECHKEHGQQYPQSAHATSLSERSTLKAFRNYIKFSTSSDSSTGALLRDNCFTCHSPRVKNASDSLLEDISGLIVTAIDYPDSVKGKSSLKELSKISIDCCVCHIINGMPEGEVEPNMLYGPGWDEHELAHTRDHGLDTVGSPYLMSSDMCTRCHYDWLAGVPSIVKKMHRNSKLHLMEADLNNKTCQSCHMMDGEMVIHNMPVYSGTLSFKVEQTADRIGLTMAIVSFLGIFLNMMSIAYSKRMERKRAKGVDVSDSVEILPVINAGEFFPQQAGAQEDSSPEIEDNIDESDETPTY